MLSSAENLSIGAEGDHIERKACVVRPKLQEQVLELAAWGKQRSGIDVAELPGGCP